MKRLFLLSLALTLTLLLSACGECQHEWTEADCVTGSVCTKCDEPGQPALGHDWSAATCTAPETCTRCAATQGSPLDHTFGDWSFENGQMFRLCTGCSAEERTDADPEVYLQQVLPGHWDFTAYEIDGQRLTSDDLRYGSVGPYAAMNADGTCTFFNGSRLFENGTWKFTEYKQTEDFGNTYYLEASFPDTTPALIALGDREGQPHLYFIAPDTGYIQLHQNKPLASALTGCWSGINNGTLYTLQLNADRTVTGDLDGPVTGTWHLEPVTQNNNYRSCTLMILYYKEDYPSAIITSLSLGSTEQPLEEALENLSFSMWQNRLGSVRFERSDPTLQQQLEDAVAAGPGKLIGTWQSEMLEYRLISDGTETRLDTTEYSMTFAEDGTFTAIFDKEYTGTWKFNSADQANDEIRYRYHLLFDGAERNMEIETIGRGRIYFGGSNDVHSIFSWFNQISDGTQDHAALAPDLITGTWTTVAMEQSRTAVDPIPYTLTVNPDGTFTADFGETVTGTWTYQEYDYGYYGYQYAFMPDGANCSMIYSIPDPGTLRTFYDIGGIPTSMTMSKN